MYNSLLANLNIHTQDCIKIDNKIIAIYRSDHNEKNYDFSITTNLMSFILSGAKKINSPDGDCVVIGGEFIFLRSGRYIMSHTKPEGHKPYSALLIFIDNEDIEKFVLENSSLFECSSKKHSNSLISIPLGKINPSILATIESILHHFSFKNPSDSNVVKLKTEALLHQVLEADFDETLKKEFFSISYDKNTDLRHYMEKNFCQPITIAEFSKNTSRSLSTFKKEFFECFNKSPKRWINEKRIEKAAHLIKTSQMNVTEICFLCGFGSLSHFIQIFSLRYGVTPKKYKTKINKN